MTGTYFVVTCCGFSGSKWLAAAFDKHPEILCTHAASDFRIRERPYNAAELDACAEVEWKHRHLKSLDDYLGDLGFYSEEFSKMTATPGALLLYCMGARLLEAFPYVAVVDGLGLMIGVVSYDGQLGFGLTADNEALPELADLADGVSQAFDDLEEAVGP